MSTEQTVLATLSAPDKTGKGQMQVVGEEKSRTYRLGNSDFDVEPGLYHVTYREVENTYDGYTYVSRYLNEIQPALPSSLGQIRAFLSTLTSKRRATKLARKLKSRLGADAEPNDYFEQLRVRKFLTSVSGIGPKTAHKILEGLDAITDTHYDVFRLFKQWGLPFSQTALRCQWAIHYFQKHPDQLKEAFQCPYVLLDIADRNRRDVRQAQTENLQAHGFTFKEIDEAALESDPRWKEHATRIRYFLTHAMEEVMQDGHTVATDQQMITELRRAGIRRIRESLDDDEGKPLSAAIARDAIYETSDLTNVRFRTSDGEEDWGVALTRVTRWQRTIAQTVKRLTRSTPLFSREQARRMYQASLKGCPFEPTLEQKQALKHGFSSRLSAVVGPAGSGKTSVSQLFLEGAMDATYSQELPDPLHHGQTNYQTALNLYVLAPTGVATQRIRHGLTLTDPRTGQTVEPKKINRREIYSFGGSTLDDGDLYLGTLHSFLGYCGGSQYNIPPAHPSVIFVDETSMCDEEVIYHLMRYVESCLEEGIPVSLMLSGDINQLPPVGAGYPFRDLLGTQFGSVIPSTFLSTVQRQSGDSMIVRAAHHVLEGRDVPLPDELEGCDEDFIWTGLTGESIPTMLKNYAHYLRQQGHQASSKDIQVILPLRNPSKVEPDAPYVRDVNQQLQQHYHGRSIQRFTVINDRGERVSTYQVGFAKGDRVIHIGENGYNADRGPAVMRGSIGEITAISKHGLKVEYPWADQAVRYADPTELSQLGLAYAITGHSSQGSEFDYVLLALPDRAGPTLVDRAWLYTAMTRAKEHLYLAAPAHRVADAVRHSYGAERNTLLAKELVDLY